MTNENQEEQFKETVVKCVDCTFEHSHTIPDTAEIWKCKGCGREHRQRCFNQVERT